MSVASPDDVAERLGRPLNPEEELTVTNLLEDAEVKIRIKGGASRLTDPVWHAHVIEVECDMVLRAARLSAKVSGLIPATENLEDGDPAFQNSYRTPYLTRDNRRTLGLRLNGMAGYGPSVPSWWVNGEC